MVRNKTLFPKFRHKAGCSLTLLLFSILLKLLTDAIRKWRKWYINWEGRNKNDWFADDMFVYVEKCKIDQTLSELISDYKKFSEYIGFT